MTPSSVCDEPKDRFADANQAGDGVIEVRLDRGIRGVSAAWAKRIIDRTLRLENMKGRSVGVLLTGDAVIRKINRKFLRHDYATDVIAFGLNAGKLGGIGSGYLGDLVVSAETAKKLSARLGIAWKEELARYLVHGTLHLLGYEDQTPRKRKKMHLRQEHILRLALQPR